MFRYETSKNIEEEEEKRKEFENDLNALKNEMQKIVDEREEKHKVLKEKSKKWDALQQEKDGKSNKLANLQKKDEALHAEMIERNKSRKESKAAVVTVRY